MGNRFLTPETTRLELSGGDYLIVKKRLNAGEGRQMMARMVREMRPESGVTLDPMQVGRSKAVAFLLDWTFTDAHGKPVVIRGKSADEIGRVLDALDPDSYSEVTAAIEAHESAMDAEREQEKNGQGGETKLPVTSLSAA